MSFGGVTLRHKGAKLGQPLGIDPTGGVVNRYSGTLSSTGLVYRAVEYRDIYPGITMRLSFEGRSIKADYIVAPGADPRVIRFRYGAATAALEETGDLIAGEIRQPAPIVLQDGVTLPSRYEIGEDGWVRFVISPHDRTRPLLIDPYVVTGRAYVGGGLTDRISAMAVDASGFIYLAGATESTDIATPVRPRADGVEAYILKVNPANLQVIYATYLGGAADDRALAIAVDASGSAYVAGQTGSADFPALPGFHGGSTDGFIARLNATGALQFATFLGGSGEDTANGVAIKPDGSAWIVGETTSSSMPLFGVAYQSVNRGAQEVMLRPSRIERLYCIQRVFRWLRQRPRCRGRARQRRRGVLYRRHDLSKLSGCECVPQLQRRPSGCVHRQTQRRWSDAAIQHVSRRVERILGTRRNRQLDRCRLGWRRHRCRHDSLE